MTETRTVDIVDPLMQDHRHMQQLLAEIVSTAPRSREELFWEMVPQLIRHEIAEEMVVYPTVWIDAPDAAAVVDARLMEQAEAEEMLAKMETLDCRSAEFGQALGDLQYAVLQHARAEELNIFPFLLALEPVDARIELAARYQKAKASAPTHPHSETPDTPPGNKLIGAISVFTDKVRDALIGL
jgi:hemerythrin superfamily protein